MSKTVTGQQVIRVFEEWAPKTLAMEGDNVGLQVGTLNRPVRKIMVTLDVLENVIDEAIEKQVNLIIAHHPFLYNSLSQIDTNQEKGRIIKKLIQHDITVYAGHTNLDLANGGVNDMLIEALGLESDGAVMELGNEPLFKLVVFVPESHEEQVRNALGENGAGHIGN